MGKLIDNINDDLKAAMKAKSELELSVLRMLIAALKNKRIELKKQEDITDEEALAVIKSELKKRKDSIEAYKEGNRQDLVDKEEAEARVLNKYLPEQLGNEDIKKIVKKVIDSFSEVGPSDFGKIMGVAMGKLKNRADGNQVKDVVNKLLNK